MFTNLSLVKLIYPINILDYTKKKPSEELEFLLLFVGLCSALCSASPQVRLHPDDLLLLLPDDGTQAGQEGRLITPGVWSYTVI